MNDARNRILASLARNGGWMGRAELAQTLQYTEQRVDDELADLVTEGTVLFNPRGRDYRLGFTALARKALQRLLLTGEKRVILGASPTGQQTLRMGVAVRARDFTGSEVLAVAELEMPFDPTDPTHLKALEQAMGGLDRTLAHMEGAALPRPEFVPATQGAAA